MKRDGVLRKAQGFHMVVSCYIFFLTFYAISMGAESFMGLLAVTLPIFLLTLLTAIVMLVMAIFYSFKTKPVSFYLAAVSVMSVPFVILALDNIFYFYEPLVLPTNSIILISAIYSVTSLLFVIASKVREG